MKGSTRKPLEAQKGHLKVVDIENRKRQEAMVKTGSEEIRRPPVWLKNKTARKEWKRILPQLLRIDVVGNLDLANIAGYCVAYAKYQEATVRLEEEGLTIDTEKGRMENPLVQTQLKYAQDLRRFADLCGMSVGSRLKAAAQKTAQEEEKLEKAFGGI